MNHRSIRNRSLSLKKCIVSNQWKFYKPSLPFSPHIWLSIHSAVLKCQNIQEENFIFLSFVMLRWYHVYTRILLLKFIRELFKGKCTLAITIMCILHYYYSTITIVLYYSTVSCLKTWAKAGPFSPKPISLCWFSSSSRW